MGTGFFLYVMFLKFRIITFALAPLMSGAENNYPVQEVSFANALFLSLLAISLGFCFTTYIWMSNVFHKNFRVKRLIRISQTNSLFIIGLMSYMLFRHFTIIMTFNLTQIDFNLVDNFGLVIFILPVFIFLYNWMQMIKAFRSMKALLISISIFCLLGLILSATVT